MAALAIAAAATLALGAIAWFGLPAWARSAFAASAGPTTPLLFTLDPTQDYRQLDEGGVYFAASGTITNPTPTDQKVPPIIAELRDTSGRVVHSWRIAPPVKVLGPGEQATFTEAQVNIPATSSELTVRWPGAGE